MTQVMLAQQKIAPADQRVCPLQRHCVCTMPRMKACMKTEMTNQDCHHSEAVGLCGHPQHRTEVILFCET